MGDFPVPQLSPKRQDAGAPLGGRGPLRQADVHVWKCRVVWKHLESFGTHLYFKLITLGTIDLGTMLLGICDIWKFDQPELGISEFGG